MKWYYVENGQQAGPVEEAQLAELVQSGKLRSDTLVWHEGMAAWQAFSAVQPAGINLPAAAPAATSSFTGEATEAVCAECRNMFRKEDMIRHGSAYICANCKPVFMQKLSEGVRLNTGELHYAGFWIRFVAKLLDGLILGIPLAIVMVVVGVAAAGSNTGGGPNVAAINAVSLLLQLVFYVINILYGIFFIGKYGATPGKMICRLRVVTSTGEKVSYGRATGRVFAELLSGLICYIGYIIAAFDSEKRALHDHICNTRVVMK